MKEEECGGHVSAMEHAAGITQRKSITGVQLGTTLNFIIVLNSVVSTEKYSWVDI